MLKQLDLQSIIEGIIDQAMERVEFNLECLPEHSPVRGNLCAMDDAEEDRRAEDQVIADLESGNEYAWCILKVTATIPGVQLVGTDYLGHCSYRDRIDAMNSDYMPDMKDNARKDLRDQLLSLFKSLNSK